jgi:heme A synthase
MIPHDATLSGANISAAEGGEKSAMTLNRFAKYAWAVIGVNLIVILWGAFVRASVSGDGCGNHWPLCNGEVLPSLSQAKTLIELTHRLTSGIALLMVVGLLVWAFRAYPRQHPVRWGAKLSLFFMLTEALIGAGLVIFRMVAENTSTARAFWISGHLVNTFLLLAAMTLTAWWASGGARMRGKNQGALAWVCGTALAGMLILGVSGAVTALGDTLFPARSLAEGLRQDLSPTAHILIRLRVLHPLIAVVVSLYVIFAASLARARRPVPQVKRLAAALAALVIIQLAAGVLNLALLAPIWMQLVHLLLSDFVWMALVLLTAAALAETSPGTEAVRSFEAARAEELKDALKTYPALSRSREG